MRVRSSSLVMTTVERGPDAGDLLQAQHAIFLFALVAAVEDLGAHDHEVVLADEGDDARIQRIGLLRARFELIRRMGAAVGVGERGVRVEQRVGVVVERAAADVLVGEVGADEALLTLGAGNAADAPERGQEQEALVLGAVAFPDQEAGAGDVVGIREPHQQAVADGVALGAAGAPSRASSVSVRSRLRP